MWRVFWGRVGPGCVWSGFWALSMFGESVRWGWWAPLVFGLVGGDGLFLALFWEHRVLIPVRVGWNEGFIDLVYFTSNASFACNKELSWLPFIHSLAFVFGWRSQLATGISSTSTCVQH